MEKKENRRVITEGVKRPIHVIHEGLQNYPAFQIRLESIADKLNRLSNNTNSHLADIGCGIRFEIDKLQLLMNDIFSQHDIEKIHGIQPPNNHNPLT